jgi:DNA (cytosine-5)-methyltransferase 1
MTRPRLLDLYGGEQGAAEGYRRAGFDVLSVDIEPLDGPGPLVVADALTFLREHGHEFAAIHASPPCQSESDLRHRTGYDYTDWLAPTLAALASYTVPWVVENVDSTTQLPGALILCGSEFGLTVVTQDGVRRTLRRHRRFGSNVWLWGAGGDACSGRPIVGVYGTGGGGQMTRGYKATLAEAREVMEMPWASRAGVSEAIPPAYTEFVGRQLMAALGEVAA